MTTTAALTPARRAELLEQARVLELTAAALSVTDPAASVERFREAEAVRRHAEQIGDRIISDLYAKADGCDAEAARVRHVHEARAVSLSAEATGYRTQANAIIVERQEAFMADLAAVLDQLAIDGQPIPVGGLLAVG